MTTNAPPHADAGMQGRPPGGSSRRFVWLLALMLLLLLIGGGAGGAWWWVHHSGKSGTDDPGPGNPNQPTTPADAGLLCSDDADPKVLDRLEFGPPIETKFDRGRLDALPDRPIPDIEKYPWQPAELVAVLGEHRMRGQFVAANSDGKLLAVGSPGDGWVRIGETETVHEKALVACPRGARAVAWAPGGESLAVSCGDGVVRLYDVRDLDKISDPQVLDKATGLVTCLSYSADGKYLLGGDSTPLADNAPKVSEARVWDVETRKIINTLRHGGPVNSVAFSPVSGDYRALTGGGVKDARVHLWENAVGSNAQATIDKGKTDDSSYVGDVAFSPDGKRAASALSDATVHLWDLNNFKLDQERYVLKDHYRPPNNPPSAPVLAYSPDGRYVASARGPDGSVQLWDAETGTKVRPLATTGGAYVLRFLGRGDRLAFTGSLSSDYNVHIHEVETGKELRPPVGHLNGVTCVSLAPDGQNVASGGSDYTVRLWGLDTLEARHTVGSGALWTLGFHPDARRVFYGGLYQATLPLIDVESGQVKTPAYNNQHPGGIYSAAITRDGRYALTGGYQDGTVRMWRLRDGRQVRSFPLGDGPTARVTLSPDMHRAVSVGGKTHLLQLRCQSVLHDWPTPVAWAPFLPDARVAFFGGADAPLWQVTGQEPEETGKIDLNLTGMGAASLSADGKRVAALLGGRVVVFRMEPAKQLWEWTPPPHFGGVAGVALSADGRDLLTANGDGTVYVIRLP